MRVNRFSPTEVVTMADVVAMLAVVAFFALLLVLDNGETRQLRLFLVFFFLCFTILPLFAATNKQ